MALVITKEHAQVSFNASIFAQEGNGSLTQDLLDTKNQPTCLKGKSQATNIIL